MLGFGLAAVLVVAGGLCGVLVSGLTGEVLAIALIALGAGGALLLAFLEVGLSEDRERLGEAARRRKEAGRSGGAQPRPRLPRRPRRPG